jgi:hypothetical protein
VSEARAAERRAIGALWLIAIAATAVIFRNPHWLAGGYDWRYFQSAMEAARRSVAWFHEWPLYNPYMCGGEPQLANPQSIAGSPAFLLVALFGTALGERLMMVLFIGLGLDGTYRLARQLGVEREGALAAAASFGLCGWVVLHLGIGHVSFFGATLIPHALYFYLRARTDLRYAIGLGAAMAAVLAQGGNSTVAMAAIALGVVALVDTIADRSPAPLLALLCGALACVALGAYRLLPTFEFALDHPRHVTESDAQSPLELMRAAFVWGGTGKLPGHRYGVHEYAWRLPYLAWALLPFGLWLPRLRRLALALFLVGAGIALGDWISHGPWWLMRHVPVLRDLRVPSRYALLCALGLSLVAGAGAARLADRLGRTARRTRLFGLLLAAVLFAEGVIYANVSLVHVFDLPAPPIDRAAPFHQVRGHWSRMMELVFGNHGVIGCDEEAPLTRAAALDEGPGPQVALADPAAGSVQLLRWSPDRIEAMVVLDRPSELLVNLNWNEHWKASVGEVVRYGPKWPADRDGGRLAVRLPGLPGQPVVLRYRPTSAIVGAAISVAAMLGFGWVLLRRRRRVLY